MNLSTSSLTVFIVTGCFIQALVGHSIDNPGHSSRHPKEHSPEHEDHLTGGPSKPNNEPMDVFAQIHQARVKREEMTTAPTEDQSPSTTTDASSQEAGQTESTPSQWGVPGTPPSWNRQVEVQRGTPPNRYTTLPPYMRDQLNRNPNERSRQASQPLHFPASRDEEVRSRSSAQQRRVQDPQQQQRREQESWQRPNPQPNMISPGYPNDYGQQPPQQPQAWVSRNMALEVELLRLTDDQQRICPENNGQCEIEVLSTLNIGSQSPGGQSRTPIQLRSGWSSVAEINLRTEQTVCEYRGGRMPSVLRVEVHPNRNSRSPTFAGDYESPSLDRQVRQVTESSTTTGSTTDKPDSSETNGDSTSTTTMYPSTSSTQTWRRQPAEDQYSRNRYDETRDRQAPRLDSGSSRGPSNVEPWTTPAIFECDIILQQGERQESHNAQWQTVPCRPLDSRNRMELMFRYVVYRTDATNCRQASEAPTWKPLNVSPRQ